MLLVVTILVKMISSPQPLFLLYNFIFISQPCFTETDQQPEMDPATRDAKLLEAETKMAGKVLLLHHQPLS
jgi:hypothetical protein